MNVRTHCACCLAGFAFERHFDLSMTGPYDSGLEFIQRQLKSSNVANWPPYTSLLCPTVQYCDSFPVHFSICFGKAGFYMLTKPGYYPGILSQFDPKYWILC